MNIFINSMLTRLNRCSKWLCCVSFLLFILFLCEKSLADGYKINIYNFTFQGKTYTALTLNHTHSDSFEIRLGNARLYEPAISSLEIKKGDQSFEQTATNVESILRFIRNWYIDFLLEKGRITKDDPVYTALNKPIGLEDEISYVAIMDYNDISNIRALMSISRKDPLPLETEHNVRLTRSPLQIKSFRWYHLPPVTPGPRDSPVPGDEYGKKYDYDIQVKQYGLVEFKNYARNGEQDLIPLLFRFAEGTLVTLSGDYILNQETVPIQVPENYLLQCDDSKVEYYEGMGFRELPQYRKPNVHIMIAGRLAFQLGVNGKIVRKGPYYHLEDKIVSQSAALPKILKPQTVDGKTKVFEDMKNSSLSRQNEPSVRPPTYELPGQPGYGCQSLMSGVGV